LAAAIGGIERFIDREDNVGHRDVARQPGKRIPPARASYAIHQLVPAKLAEQLLQIRERNVLALADGGQCYRPALLAQREVYHCCDGEASLGRGAHDGYPARIIKWADSAGTAG